MCCLFVCLLFVCLGPVESCPSRPTHVHIALWAGQPRPEPHPPAPQRTHRLHPHQRHLQAPWGQQQRQLRSHQEPAPAHWSRQAEAKREGEIRQRQNFERDLQAHQPGPRAGVKGHPWEAGSDKTVQSGWQEELVIFLLLSLLTHGAGREGRLLPHGSLGGWQAPPPARVGEGGGETRPTDHSLFFFLSAKNHQDYFVVQCSKFLSTK